MSTIKQEKAFEKVVENGGNVSKAMREAGYSPETAKTPQKLTDSKGWLELLEEHLPDSLITEKHRQLLTKTDAEGNIDVNAVRPAIDMAYKLKGKYAPEKSVNLNMEAVITDPKAFELAKEYEQKLKESL